MSTLSKEHKIIKLRNRLLPLLLEKQNREGRKITYTEVAAATDSSVNVISQWAKDNITRFDAEMVIRLCRYFECEIGDLLYLEDVEDNNQSAT